MRRLRASLTSHTASTTVTTYQRGTLIIDVLDAREKKLIWRGTAEGIVPEKPEKEARKIEKAIDKIVSKWQRMKKNM